MIISFKIKKKITKISRFLSTSIHSMPFNTDKPLGFEVALLFDAIFCWSGLITAIAFLAIYVSSCTYIWTCIDDLAIIVTNSNNIAEYGAQVKMHSKQFLELCLDCYR